MAHSEFLATQNRYSFLFDFDARDYRAWANGLKKAGYATDKKYPAKLIRLIEDYKLYEFDNIKKKDFSYKKPKREKKVKSSSKKTYTVQKGDTLYSISRRFGVSVNQLKKRNKLKDNIIGKVLN